MVRESRSAARWEGRDIEVLLAENSWYRAVDGLAVWHWGVWLSSYTGRWTASEQASQGRLALVSQGH